MLSLENKNTKVNGSNNIRSLNQNFKARLKDKLGFTINPYTLVNNALRCKKSGSLQFKGELLEEVTSKLIRDNSALSYDKFAYNYFTKLLYRQKCTEINCDNEAFDGANGSEIARILRKLADKIDGTDVAESIMLQDINGNTVGAFTVK